MRWGLIACLLFFMGCGEEEPQPDLSISSTTGATTADSSTDEINLLDITVNYAPVMRIAGFGSPNVFTGELMAVGDTFLFYSSQFEFFSTFWQINNRVVFCGSMFNIDQGDSMQATPFYPCGEGEAEDVDNCWVATPTKEEYIAALAEKSCSDENVYSITRIEGGYRVVNGELLDDSTIGLNDGTEWKTTKFEGLDGWDVGDEVLIALQTTPKLINIGVSGFGSVISVERIR